MEKITSPEQLKALHESIVAKRDPDKACVTVCAGTGCLAYGTQKLIDNFKDEIKEKNLEDTVSVRSSGCHGFCERGPIVVNYPEKTFYQKVGLDDAAEILDKTIAKGEIIDRLLYEEPVTGEKITLENDVPFYNKQMRLLLAQNPEIDPMSTDDFLAVGGYQALAKAISTMTPEGVIQEVIDADLRGRGGGGFPAGWKWDSTRKAEGDIKYVICNADEGDPGAYMDRSLLEGNPHSILEGMLIGAYAIGSSQGYIYVRNEYPLAVANATLAIENARKLGLLGDNILGSTFSFDIKIVRGGGAFVCGESSALFASIEGRSGEPRAKYVHATDKGLYDKPTCLNNVETWANVPLIINKGATWYQSIGTEGSKGTKIFALVGKINNTGLVEVPMGTTLREIIFDIGGGIPDGREFKAVQTGGPSGGCIPKEYLDTRVDFDELTKLGSMMGSGGMIVMDDRNCMVDVARYFLGFLEEESCGKCTPCREGVHQMRLILDRICEGNGKEDDIDTLQWMGEAIADGSLCALGGSAPAPVLSTIRYFREEYEAHIRDKKCPAGVCKALITYTINADCTGCRLCVKPCPTQAITGEKKQLHILDQDKCIQCGACYEVCKDAAVTIA
ncbi:MAG: 4Fe-4S binding protein [Deltaproteobacteria bacterium]|jgi:NADH:ubiquinone oxidoreductase subunit F (NADH-binding)/(2Fe-2S) ferredoxin|nr:4Fe-4S binding protein [Deltaproteobacteria bacterium]MBT4641668.1 4Fe-4S binding protein [Deltaproteobacteria bacterium]MBT6498575.1 4Fe-4S binding protein [Deltaproteobacteria bacterium]MBT6615480.1 4Fe-4S binding protein [Deltaproteobacteria bacterium]MBT7155640.1 4Fe-4S binding protein [Deltaproteobacteria bacterium]